MKHHSRALQLIWNINRFRYRMNDVELAIAPTAFPPFPVNAIVEEQDTALVLGETNEIRDPGDKPAWYLANKLETQALRTPGEVIMKNTLPLRLQAIILDLDAERCCNERWISQAIENLFDIARLHYLRAVQLPPLGTRFGSISNARFIKVLLEILLRQRPSPVQKLWLTVSEQQCESFYHELLDAIEQYPA